MSLKYFKKGNASLPDPTGPTRFTRGYGTHLPLALKCFADVSFPNGFVFMVASYHGFNFEDARSGHFLGPRGNKRGVPCYVLKSFR